MFPFSFEWVWDMSHCVFMGGLWYALSILGIGLAYCFYKAARASCCEENGGHH